MKMQKNPAIGMGWVRPAVVTVLVGVVSGAAGTLLAALLRLVQHVGYAYSEGSLKAAETFLEGVTASSPSRRVVVMVICGVIAGVGWWLLYRHGSKLVQVDEAVLAGGPRMPPKTTLMHDVIQIVTVGLGSPLGREVAPRELGAVAAQWLSDRVGLDEQQTRVMMACGAGAGLAAVYNVPLASVLFVVETLLGSMRFAVVAPALASCSIATVISWMVLGDEPAYRLPGLVAGHGLGLWAALAGPLFGLAAWGFIHLARVVREKAPKDWRLVPWCIGVFTVVGVLAIWFPALLGNGKSVTLLGFGARLGIGMALALLVLRALVTLGAIRAGASGGLLTPSVALGTMMATVLALAWNAAGGHVLVSACAVVGGAAFLAAAQRMPLTAIALMMEFTRVGSDFVVPMLLACAGAVAVARLCGVRSRDAVRRPFDTGALEG